MAASAKKKTKAKGAAKVASIKARAAPQTAPKKAKVKVAALGLLKLNCLRDLQHTSLMMAGCAPFAGLNRRIGAKSQASTPRYD